MRRSVYQFSSKLSLYALLIVAGTVFGINTSYAADCNSNGIEDSLEPDGDGDTIIDYCDNCSLLPNTDQRDSDGDSFGNRCDADLDNNLWVNFSDAQVFIDAFGKTDRPEASFDDNTFVNFSDAVIFIELFSAAPGPGEVPTPPPPGPVVLDIDPAPLSNSSALRFDDPVSITFNSDNADGIYYRIDYKNIFIGNLDSDCLKPYDGANPIEIKDHTWISFYGKGNEDWGTTNTPANKKRYEIRNPVYPNSVLRNDFIAAEYAIANKILCEQGIVDPLNSTRCIPDLDVQPKNGTISEIEINNFLFSFHDWPTQCPEGGDARFQWLYLGVSADGLWPNIRINMHYNDCAIDGLVLNGTLGSGGLASVGNLQHNLRQTFDTSTQVEVTGRIDGVFKETSGREFNGLLMIEQNRSGNHYVSCSDFGCSPNSIEVRYQFNGPNYTMYDPYQMYLDSCTHIDDATEAEVNGS